LVWKQQSKQYISHGQKQWLSQTDQALTDLMPSSVVYGSSLEEEEVCQCRR